MWLFKYKWPEAEGKACRGEGWLDPVSPGKETDYPLLGGVVWTLGNGRGLHWWADLLQDLAVRTAALGPHTQGAPSIPTAEGPAGQPMFSKLTGTQVTGRTRPQRKRKP